MSSYRVLSQVTEHPLREMKRGGDAPTTSGSDCENLDSSIRLQTRVRRRVTDRRLSSVGAHHDATGRDSQSHELIPDRGDTIRGQRLAPVIRVALMAIEAHLSLRVVLHPQAKVASFSLHSRWRSELPYLKLTFSIEDHPSRQEPPYDSHATQLRPPGQPAGPSGPVRSSDSR